MNELLYWMSIRRSGSAKTFASKVAEAAKGPAGAAPHKIAEWNLACLGHAEFLQAAGSDGWRIAPPVLAAVEGPNGSRGVLCGARTPRLVERVTQAAAASGARLHQYQQPFGPDVVEVTVKQPTELESIAAASHTRLQWNAPLALLACVPGPKSLSLEPTDIPIGGWIVSQFSKATFEWLPSTQPTALAATSGLFRFRSDYETKYVLIEDGSPFACEPSIAKYRLFKRRDRALRYSAAEKKLSIHSACRPPSLVERALVLCSGELPRIADRWLDYPCVEGPTATAVASLLGQRLS